MAATTGNLADKISTFNTWKLVIANNKLSSPSSQDGSELWSLGLRADKDPLFSCVCSGDDFTRDLWPADPTSTAEPPVLPPKAEIDAAKARAQDSAGRIFKSQSASQAMLLEYGQLIKKKWSSKGPQARAQVLLEAKPIVSKKKNDDWTALWIKTPNPDAFLLAALNVEELSKGDTLLLFLESRVNNLPGTFALADLERARMGIVTNIVDRPKYLCLPGYTMAIEKLEVGDLTNTYGKIYSPADLDHLRETTAITEQKFMFKLWTPQPGLLVLEKQAEEMEFLETCCKLLLQELNLSVSLNTAQTGVSSLIPLLDSTEDTARLEWHTVIAQAPYRTPGDLDYTKLLQLVEVKNPEYFAEILTEDKINEVRETPKAEPSSTSTGAKKKAAKKQNKDESSHWNDLLRHLVADSHSHVALWKTVEQALHHIQAFSFSHGEQIDRDIEIPDEYVAVLRLFKGVLHQLQHVLVAKLRRGVPSPTIDFQLMAHPMPGIIPKRVLPEERVSHLVAVLSDESYKNAIGLQNICDQLATVVNGLCVDVKSSRYTAWHLEIISDLGIVAQIDRQFQLFTHQRLASDPFYDWVYEHSSKCDDTKNLYTAVVEANNQCHKSLRKMDLAQYGAVESGRFRYPVDKKRSPANTETMIKSEQNLDEFWAKVNERIQEKQDGKRLPDLFNIDEPAITRTGPWVEEEPSQPPRAITKTVATSSKVTDGNPRRASVFFYLLLYPCFNYYAMLQHVFSCGYCE
ncbi:hypothetical protein EJ08DRAFT_683151 [Tothia fuscella]|uniref:Uncharacterized protein n=1 Tax=Tothia fuscella TaxID=1048955 RepID=A0A9P4TU12_9PEZI|nr:hypothetical protein EJ08DRAFT_683151 [Tothia fuscella]